MLPYAITTEIRATTFGRNRLLFHIDNDPNAGKNGAHDLVNMSLAGLASLRSAIDFATPLTAVPELTSTLLGLFGLGLLGRHH